MNNPAPSWTFKPIKKGVKTKKNSKKLLFIFIYIFLFIIGITSALGYKIINLKKELKSLTEKQKQTFQELTLKYDEALVLMETIPEPEQEQGEAQLSSTFKEKVLGLETSPYVVQTRQLSNLFKQSNNLVSDIKEQNQQIKTKLQTPYFNYFLPQANGLTDKTANFAVKSRELLNYFQKSTDLNLQLFNFGVEVGASIEDAIYRNADKTAIRNLESKINEIDSIKNQWQTIDISLLSSDLQTTHQQSIQSIKDFKVVLIDIKNSIEQKNVQKLVKELQSLAIQSTAEGETATIQSIHLWENNQIINSAYNLQNDWQEFYNKL